MAEKVETTESNSWHALEIGAVLHPQCLCEKLFFFQITFRQGYSKNEEMLNRRHRGDIQRYPTTNEKDQKFNRFLTKSSRTGL